MKRVLAIHALALVACGGGIDGATPSDDAGFPDATVGCVLGIDYTPANPVLTVDVEVFASARVTGAATGSHTYTWVLLRDNVRIADPIPVNPANLENTEVKFPIPLAGVYTIAFQIEDLACLQAREQIEVHPQNIGTVGMRVHVVAPDPERPPLVKSVTVQGGASDLIPALQLDAAITFTGHLESPNATSVAGYVRFMPTVGGEAAVETFADPFGDYQVKVRPETHSVLVIPVTTNVPPQIVTWQQQPTLTLGAGQVVTGVVHKPNGTPLAGATVQLSINPAPTDPPGPSVPSTIGVTAANGTFSLSVMPRAGALVRIEVTAPASSGLPRLIAESLSFNPAMPVTVDYNAALATQDLGNVQVQRLAAALPGAHVSIVGTIDAPNAGSITAGATQQATGEVRVSAVTSVTGALPAMLVPAAQLSAVVFPGAVGDHAITPIDLRTSVPIAINAAAMTPNPTQLREPTNTTPLPGAVLDAVPTGDLALAGAPTIRKVAADVTGNLTINLAPNGTYQLRLSDPNGNRAALAKIPTTGTVAASLPLVKATRVTGSVLGQSTIPGAIVQFLCGSCTGLERARPIAEGVTGIDGSFSLAVPDPN